MEDTRATSPIARTVPVPLRDDPRSFGGAGCCTIVKGHTRSQAALGEGPRKGLKRPRGILLLSNAAASIKRGLFENLGRFSDLKLGARDRNNSIISANDPKRVAEAPTPRRHRSQK